jgi:LasA protease
MLLASCLPQGDGGLNPISSTGLPADPTSTPEPERPKFDPGELVDYIAQAGDTLPALAARFNTTVEEIRTVNQDLQIPADATTMPLNMPMKIPIYYLPFWGPRFQILPNSQFVDGPATTGFDTAAFVALQPGWLKSYTALAGDSFHSGVEMVDLVAINYSISPRVLLALLDYQTGALSQPVPPSGRFPLGQIDHNFSGLYMQLIWAARMLNNGYYGWRTGSLTEFEHSDGTIERPDPWQTAASVGLQYYFSRHFSSNQYRIAISPEGVARTYNNLFGDPWVAESSSQTFIPASLQQPNLSLPFRNGETWSFTSGPHAGWGNYLLQPWAALDFGPPEVNGCASTLHYALAMADGEVVRSDTGVVMLDLNSDDNERTGWVILYLHVATTGRASLGEKLKKGDPVGYPSCEGGDATGTHIHIARKYNGEWIPVNSAISFNLEGWIASLGDSPREGTLMRGDMIVSAPYGVVRAGD